MNVVLWLMAGAVMALLANFRANAVRRQRLLVDAAFSALGALLAGMAAVPAGEWFSFEVDWPGMAAAACGAAALLAVANIHALRDARR